MIIGRKVFCNTLKMGVTSYPNNSTFLGSQSTKKCFSIIKDLDSNPNESSYFEQSGLKADLLSKKQQVRSAQQSKTIQKSTILSKQIIHQLLLTNRSIPKQYGDNSDKIDEDNDNYQNGKSNVQVDQIQKEISVFLGTDYDGRVKDDFIKFLNEITEERAQQLQFHQACIFILEIGRNPHRKRFKYIYKKTLFKLLERFMELSPLRKILEHIEKKNDTFDRNEFSFVELEFLRTTLPQIIISLQNCGYYHSDFYDQYYAIFNCKGFKESQNIMVKTLIGLMWSYKKFDSKIDYNVFIDQLIQTSEHMIYINALRLLWLTTTHFEIDESQNQQDTTNFISKEKLETIKDLFLKKLEQQKIVIFNDKNSIQLLQIIYKLYPTYAAAVHENKENELQALCEQDKFFAAIYPNILHSQKVIRYKNESNGTQSLVLIVNKEKNNISEFKKQYHKIRSNFEKNVLAVIQNMNPNLEIQENVIIGDAYEVDLLVKEHNLVFEINGDSHYYYDQTTGQIKLFIKTHFKQRVLRLFGIKNIVNINQFHWYKLTTVAEMESYITAQLAKAKVNPSLFNASNKDNTSEKPKVQFVSNNLSNVE